MTPLLFQLCSTVFVVPTPVLRGNKGIHKLLRGGVGSSVVRGVSLSSTRRAFVKVDDSFDLCLSPIFVVTKRSEGLRVFLDSQKDQLFLLQDFRIESLTIKPFDIYGY